MSQFDFSSMGGQMYKERTRTMKVSSYRKWSVAVCMGVVERVGRSTRQVGPAYNL